MEKVGKEDGAEERVLDHLLLKELLTSLDKEERKLIYLRYFAEKTQTQVGKENIKKSKRTYLTGTS